MAIEIERKFLVTNNDWREGATGQKYMQGYINNEPGRTVRIRVTEQTAFITIKGKSFDSAEKNGLGRLEFEYQIPKNDALEMLEKLCRQPIISKYRYCVKYHGFVWEIDEFSGENEGLLFAEIELEYEDQKFDLPPWIGKEVSHDTRYFNSRLCQYPYSVWKNEV